MPAALSKPSTGHNLQQRKQQLTCMWRSVASLVLQVVPKGFLTTGLGTTLFININNSVWLFVAISVLYAVASCLIGEIARLPLIAGAADQRVP